MIACLGLYGLAAHKVAQHVKELGVRKVMGASAWSIASLLCKDFLILITVAFLLAAPIAYFLLENWLSNYAYHIELDVFPFLTTLILLLAFAGIAVGHRTVQASVSNPVLALRDE